MRIVHILKYGLAVCGLGPPNSWPTAHRWMTEEQYRKEAHLHSVCWDCVDALDAKDKESNG